MEKSIYKKVEPIKQIDIEDLEDDDEIEDDVQKILEEKPKRRGRPRKNPIPEEKIEETKPKKRGRPKKNLVQEIEDDNEDLDEFDFDTEKQDLESNNFNKNEEDFDDFENNILPGFEDDEEEIIEDDETEDNQNFEHEDAYEDDNEIEDYDEDEEDNKDSYEDDNDDLNDINEEENGITPNNYFSVNTDELNNNEKDNRINSHSNNNTYMKTYDNVFDDEEFEGLLTNEKKVVTFVGTSKNGTSFIVNNVAMILSNMGINTAILDATSNKNAYYIFTKNDENLRKIATNSFENLENETAEGIKVNNNLTVYTTIPSKAEQINNSRPILETLIRKHSLVLIDCDFSTPVEYFDKSQEIYLVQSMDVLTIQALTEFLRELKVKNVLDDRKIRIVLNKLLRIKGVNARNIVDGMSNYNDPEMSFMTELFNRNTVKVAAQIPFDEDVYIKYLSYIVECEIQINGYPKEFKQRLNSLAESIYPLLPGAKSDKRNKKPQKTYSSSFSEGMNTTLDNMRRKY